MHSGKILGIRHPSDYLMFFCVGNRESPAGSTAQLQTPPTDPVSKESVLYQVIAHGGSEDDCCTFTVASQSRRFMIYVHSKMLIVDDEYIIGMCILERTNWWEWLTRVVIVGSANINERSMAGDRDTEIAIESWQKVILFVVCVLKLCLTLTLGPISSKQTTGTSASLPPFTLG